MDSDLVLFRMEGGIATLTMNRPEKRNALSPELVEGLKENLNKAEADGARVVVLAANGPVFSAGADLVSLERLQSATFEENLDDSTRLADLFRLMRGTSYPIVAAVHGHAIAGGAGLVVASDYSVAATNARFGFTEVKIGFVPAIVMTFAIRRLGEAAARDLLLSGRLVDATSAQRFGLVNEVVAEDELTKATRAWASHIADETSAQAVKATRNLFDEIVGRSLEETLQIAAEANARARSTEDCRAGVRAFLNREDPPWKRH